MKRVVIPAALVAAVFSFVAPLPARAVDTYDAFAASAQVHRGLFPIWQKGGDLYLELAPSQLDTDFLETIAPGNGIGEDPLWWGDTDYLPTQVLRFEQRGDSISGWNCSVFSACRRLPSRLGVF